MAVAALVAVVRVEIVKHLENIGIGELKGEAVFCREGRFFDESAIDSLALVGHQLAAVVGHLPPPNAPALFIQVSLNFHLPRLLLVNDLVQLVILLASILRVGEGLFGFWSDDEGVLFGLFLVGIAGKEIVG